LQRDIPSFPAREKACNRMTIQLTCRCGKRVAVADDTAAKKVRCPKCGDAIAVPRAADSDSDDEADAAPKSSTRDRKRKRRRQREESSGNKGLIIAGGVVVAVVLLGVLTVFGVRFAQQAKLRDEELQARRDVQQAIEWLGFPATTEKATAALLKHRSLAQPWLIEAFKDAEPARRLAVVQVVDAMGQDAKEYVPQLTSALRDSSPAVQIAAIRTLGKLGGEAKAAIPEMGAVANQPSPDVQVAALRVLGGFGSDATPAVPNIAAAISDSNLGVRAAAFDALGSLGPLAKAAVPTLADRLRAEQNQSMQARLLGVLAKIGPDARPAAPAVAALAIPVRAELKVVSETLEREEAKGWQLKAYRETITVFRGGVGKSTTYDRVVWRSTALDAKGRPYEASSDPRLPHRMRLIQLREFDAAVTDVLRKIGG
jgi:hypothetical protein